MNVNNLTALFYKTFSEEKRKNASLQEVYAFLKNLIEVRYQMAEIAPETKKYVTGWLDHTAPYSGFWEQAATQCIKHGLVKTENSSGRTNDIFKEVQVACTGKQLKKGVLVKEPYRELVVETFIKSCLQLLAAQQLQRIEEKTKRKTKRRVVA